MGRVLNPGKCESLTALSYGGLRYGMAFIAFCMLCIFIASVLILGWTPEGESNTHWQKNDGAPAVYTLLGIGSASILAPVWLCTGGWIKKIGTKVKNAYKKEDDDIVGCSWEDSVTPIIKDREGKKVSGIFKGLVVFAIMVILFAAWFGIQSSTGSTFSAIFSMAAFLALVAGCFIIPRMKDYKSDQKCYAEFSPKLEEVRKKNQEKAAAASRKAKESDGDAAEELQPGTGKGNQQRPSLGHSITRRPAEERDVSNTFPAASSGTLDVEPAKGHASDMGRIKPHSYDSTSGTFSIIRRRRRRLATLLPLLRKKD